MKSFKSGLLGIFLMMIAIVYPLQGHLDDSSIEKLQQIIALTNQKTEKTQKKQNIAQKMYSKVKKITKKPYVKKLFYGAVCIGILIIATYASYDGLFMEAPEKQQLMPDDKKLESLPHKDQKKVVPKNNPVSENRQSNKTLIPEVAPDKVSIQPDRQDNEQKSALPIIEQNVANLNTNATVDAVSEQTPNDHSMSLNPITSQENHDPKKIPEDIIDATVKNPTIQEPQKVNDDDDIDKKKKRYYELRWEDDLDFDQYHEFIALRDELSKKGLL